MAGFANPAIEQTAYRDARKKYHRTVSTSLHEDGNCVFEIYRRHYNYIKTTIK
jgi:hypothetical protein